ncbi:hypothetical protein BCR39DRAFT_67655 [Naematelia encephala]|uniref:Uncharacterized protein n=1 Tax=Naematelia encephala TaxID=71784 RepID=A0A1Y2AF94_9TREE|nr:hypothetical protein BCR39DRAFT_67655 [Naematelia encephala]
MDDAPVSGPSRPRRVPAPNLADRIVNLQRKNAAQTGSSRRPQTRKPEKDEFSRSAAGDVPAVQRTLYNPSAEFSRGPASERPSQRTLFDPTRPPALNIPRVTVSPQPITPPLPRSNGSPRVDSDDRHRLQRAEHPRRPDAPTKKLFNPDIHDPLHFHPRPVDPSRDSGTGSSSSRLGVRRPMVNGRTPEEEADRERERRKRREGSERGSVFSKKKESDARSKESRSSEGSESLKDRDRGKGKG